MVVSSFLSVLAGVAYKIKGVACPKCGEIIGKPEKYVLVGTGLTIKGSEDCRTKQGIFCKNSQESEKDYGIVSRVTYGLI